LEALRTTLQGEGIDLYVSALKKQVWDVLDKAGMIGMLGSDRIFATDREAVSIIRADSIGQGRSLELQEKMGKSGVAT
jgi:SulP family sulfate permease